MNVTVNVTVVEIAKNHPADLHKIYVLFDDPADAQIFAAEADKDYNFILLKTYEEKYEKITSPFGEHKDIYTNVSFSELKSKLIRF